MAVYVSKVGVVCMGLCIPEVFRTSLYPSATVHVLEPWWTSQLPHVMRLNLKYMCCEQLRYSCD